MKSKKVTGGQPQRSRLETYFLQWKIETQHANNINQILNSENGQKFLAYQGQAIRFLLEKLQEDADNNILLLLYKLTNITPPFELMGNKEELGKYILSWGKQKGFIK